MHICIHPWLGIGDPNEPGSVGAEFSAYSLNLLGQLDSNKYLDPSKKSVLPIKL
jgi:hypothetical protein